MVFIAADIAKSERPEEHYTIEVQTGRVSGAGTGATALLTLCGTKVRRADIFADVYMCMACV